MRKSLLRKTFHRNVEMAPPTPTHIAKSYRIVDNSFNLSSMVTQRAKKEVDLILDAIAKKLDKESESPLISDTELEIILEKIDLKSKSELMECGNLLDNPMSVEEKKLLSDRIRKTLSNAASKMSASNYDKIVMAILLPLV